MPAEVPTNKEFQELKDQVQEVAGQAVEIEEAVEKLDSLSEELSSSYEELSDRIEAVEERLADQGGPDPDPEPTKETLWGYNLTSPGKFESEAAKQGTPQVWRYFRTTSLPSPENAWGLGIPVILSFKINPRGGFPENDLREFLATKPDGLVAYMCHYHEPEDNIRAGQFTFAQYQEVTNSVTRVCREFDDVYSTPILMEWTLREQSGRNIDDYLEGMEYDVIGWDVYPPSGSMSEIDDHLKRVHDESARRGKPWLIGEIGAAKHWKGDAYTEADRAAWMLRTAEHIKALPNPPEAVAWFVYPTGGIPFPLDSQETQDAMRQILS